VREPVAFETPTSEGTEACGSRLARAMPPLEESTAIVYLQGELGSGKTTLARGVLRELGVQGTVRSPTYTLLERYETPAAIVVHLDLYRLQSGAELEPLGLRELHRPQHLWLIEWPERAQGRLPDADLRVTLEAGTNRHRIGVDASTAFGTSWLERLRKS
jgi:tRNA threonylcarbamoyladenosine biosynthesis protein TsaE